MCLGRLPAEGALGAAPPPLWNESARQPRVKVLDRLGVAEGFPFTITRDERDSLLILQGMRGIPFHYYKNERDSLLILQGMRGIPFHYYKG